MKKEQILAQIINKLTVDQTLFFEAAKAAHSAATNDENIPDNKYDTLSLEASYVAQGQANRAEELRRALTVYQNLSLKKFDTDSPIAQTALVTLEDENGQEQRFFIGPQSGGMKLDSDQGEVTVITLSSPLGQTLSGKMLGDSVEISIGGSRQEYEIVAIQ